MYTYKSKCRFRLFVFIDDGVLEIRPNQIVKSKKSINSPHLILLEDKKPKIKKPTKVIKKEKKSIKEGWHDASA